VVSDLKSPFTFCLDHQTRLRLPRNMRDGESGVWEQREDAWKAFWSTRGKEGLEKSGKAVVNGTENRSL
jgi:hypothetical protein